MEREALTAPHGFAVRALKYQEPARYEARPFRRRLPRVDTVAVHSTYEAAHADATERDLAVWRSAGFDPFAFAGPVFYLSSLPDPVLRDWLLDRGVEPPDAGEAWPAWYARAKPDPLSLRDGLDRLRFFDAAPARPKVYAVVEINWTWNDESTLNADAEGGNTVRAYRRRASADAECARLNNERQAQGEHDGYSSFESESRANGHEPRHISETVFFEVVELDAGEDGE